MNSTLARGITKQNAELSHLFNRSLWIVGNKRNIRLGTNVQRSDGQLKEEGRHNEARLRLDTWEQSGSSREGQTDLGKTRMVTMNNQVSDRDKDKNTENTVDYDIIAQTK